MNKYLACIRFDIDEYFWRVYSAREIFNKMDLADCSGEEIIHLYLLPDNGEPLIECAFHGIWHNPKHPLKMVIESGGQEIECGYGTDH